MKNRGNHSQKFFLVHLLSIADFVVTALLDCVNPLLWATVTETTQLLQASSALPRSYNTRFHAK